MRDTNLYTQILGLGAPWQVVDVKLDHAAAEVTVRGEAEKSAQWVCPRCGQGSPRYDRRMRRWRHLDTMQFKTILEADVPRINCAEHGVLLVDVPWAESGSGFTALFECWSSTGCRRPVSRR